VSNIWDDVRFWAQVTGDTRRTLICPPAIADKVRAKLDELGIAGLHDVQESPYTPAGQILVVDHNAIEASTRQAIQRAVKRPLFR
jgi:hypothetical protein